MFFTRCTNYLKKEDANSYISEIWLDVEDFRIFTICTLQFLENIHKILK